jgi:hypothetical protein
MAPPSDSILFALHESYAAHRQTPFHDREEAAKLRRRQRGFRVTFW